MLYDIAIVGGGASGVLCAINSAKNGLKVLLLEKNERIGKKLLTTGNSRCNFTNAYLSINNYHGENFSFVKSSLEKYNFKYIVEMFKKMGIEHFTFKETGKTYPRTLQASTFLDIFRFELEENSVDLRTNENVKNIEKLNEIFTITTNNLKFKSKNVVIATGGMSYPKTGSDGAGYKFLRKFGHELLPCLPALVQLKLDIPFLKAIDGVKLEETNVNLYVNDSFMDKKIGDVLFTSYGVSGPTILDLSREAVFNLYKKKKVQISIEIIDKNVITEDYFYTRLQQFSNRNIEQALIGMIHKRLIIPILKYLNIDKTLNSSDLSKNESKKIYDLLCDFKFEVIGDTGFGSSQVSQGGISTKDFNANTMESKLISGLFAIGEVLDIDGDCGGFNLHWAWASSLAATEYISQIRSKNE